MQQCGISESATPRQKAGDRNEVVGTNEDVSMRGSCIQGQPKSYKVENGSVVFVPERQSWESQQYEFGGVMRRAIYVRQVSAAMKSAWAGFTLRGSVGMSPMPCTYIIVYISIFMHVHMNVYPSCVGSRPTQFCYSEL